MRSPNGFGSCFKLNGNRRRPWVARITTGWTTAVAKRGKRKGQEVQRQLYQTVGYYESYEQAFDALTKHRLEPVSPKATMTLEELYKEWSEGAFQYISKQTQDNYRAAWKRLSKYAGAKVKEVRSAHFQAVIDSCHKDGMSRSTLEKIRIVAVQLMNYAMENDIVSKNYAKFIRLPKAEKESKARFTDLEIKKLLDRADADEWTSTVLILIYTGLRISEMLGLTQFNVDTKRHLITGGIKTDAGKNRVVPIHPKIRKYVLEWHRKNGQALICDENGKALSAKQYRKKYYAALEAAEVRRLVPHACRHTFCSMLAEKGADTLSIQKLAGHADYGFTANEYTHPEVDKLRKAIAKI